MPSVFIFIGPICSGKSTLGREMAREGFVIVNDDAIVSALHAGQYPLYQKGLKDLYKSQEDNAVSMTLALGANVVVDRPHLSASSRARPVAIGRSRDAHIVAVKFPNEGWRIHAARRFASDARGLPLQHWLDAAKRHQRDYVEPTLGEGFDRIITAEEARREFVSFSNRGS